MLARKYSQNPSGCAASVAPKKLALALIYILRILGLGFAFQGCHSKSADTPTIAFTKIPPAAEGGVERVDTIAGRVVGASPGQRIVVYAKSGHWWVQPFADQPFTAIQPNSRWSTSTHLGYEYAVLLVQPTYTPPPTMDVPPAQGGPVVAAMIVRGLPPFWQRWWFRTGSVALILLLMWCAHAYRLRQVAKQFNMRLEERVSERTRIARELHDTLLQTLQGALLRFQAASNVLLMRPEEAKRRLDNAIDQASQAIAAGRDAVYGLRSSTFVTNNLAMALSTLGEELEADETNNNSAVFAVGVEGTPRELHPILRDEVYRIAGEALRNAFRHAQARRVELEICYDQHQMRLRIRDDGKGMDSRVLDGKGQTKHWGLPGMRERAKLVGANLEVWSKVDSGTEIALSIPASVAYARSTSQ
jgi:signal transduction histidine kinase